MPEERLHSVQDLAHGSLALDTPSE